MKITWLIVTLDLPADGYAVGRQFWSAATGYSAEPPPDGDPDYAILRPVTGAPFLWLQRIHQGVPRVHLDIDVSDLGAAIDHALSVGARLVRRSADGDAEPNAVLESPGRAVFCLVQGAAQPPVSEGVPPVQAARWPGGRSLVDQVCLDIGHGESWQDEVDFWGALTGWDVEADDQWARVWTPAEWPVRVLLQRRLAGPTTAHVDVSAEDQLAEVARWESLGAMVAGQGPRWTVFQTPGGLAACVTRRDPGTGLL